MHEEKIVQYLSEEKGLGNDEILDFMSTYRSMTDKERSWLIYQMIGKELYKEYPVDMKTFIHDPYFLGSIYSDIIFPIWEDTLYDIYPAPFCKKYNEAILSCATRCFAKGTKVRMYDGTLKKVEDVKVGDKLMGVDSTARTVQSLAHGKDTLYSVNVRKNGKSFVCNGKHYLALVKWDSDEKVEVTVEDYLKWTDEEKAVWRLYHSDGIKYSSKNLPVRPYDFGMWLGGLMGSHFPDRVKLILRSTISEGCRRIPIEYKTSSIDDRRELLAGIIDVFLPVTSRIPRNPKYRNFLVPKLPLAEDIAEVARSLGISATVKPREDKLGKPVYEIFLIGGDLKNIPVQIPKNKIIVGDPKKNYLKKTFSITELGKGDFYGFELDGDHLFLLEDYLVVRNSGKSTIIVISALYEMYLLMCMISPSKVLGVKNSANLVFCFLSKDNPTACSQVGEDVHKGLTQSPFFSDTIQNNLSFSNLDKKGVQVTNNILLKAGSTVNVITGTDLIFGCLDEANMPSPKIAAENLVEVRTKLYRAMVDRRNATFSKAPALTGMIWLTSSPMDEGDVIGERIDEIKDNDIPNVFIMDNIPRWVARNEMKEDTFDFFLGSNTQDPCIVEEVDVDLSEVPEDRIVKVPRTTEYLNYFRTKPRLAIQEVAGRRTVAENAFFNSVSVFQEVFSRENHIFKKDDLKLDVNTFLDIRDYMWDPDYFKHPDHPECYRYIHLDIAEKKDRFGIASVYCDAIKYTSDEGEEIKRRKYFIDFCLGISSSKGEAVDLLKVLEFIYGLKQQGYPVKLVTTDSHQGELARQILRRHGVNTDYHSVESDQKASYFFLKNLILTKTLVGFKNPLLTGELAGLRENQKRVEKSKSTTDDLCDALAGACFKASEDTHYKDSNEAISELLNSKQNVAKPSFASPVMAAEIDWSRFNDMDYLSSLGLTINPHKRN